MDTSLQDNTMRPPRDGHGWWPQKIFVISQPRPLYRHSNSVVLSSCRFYLLRARTPGAGAWEPIYDFISHPAVLLHLRRASDMAHMHV